jgi:uncharacterized protein YsxB (DUF464 family)
MVSLKIFKTDKGKILGFEISGHSKAGKFGEDIVCAAVSSAAFMAANTILEILKANADVTVNDGYMKLIVENRDLDKTQILLEGFHLHVKSLENDYPKNIKLNSEVYEND